MIIYKFVRTDDDGRFWSALVDGKACVEYKVGEWSQAPIWLAKKGYHLFAFGSLEVAVDIKKIHSLDFKIFKCETVKIEELPHKLSMYDLNDGIITENTTDWPLNTIMAERIKLIGEII